MFTQTGLELVKIINGVETVKDVLSMTARELAFEIIQMTKEALSYTEEEKRDTRMDIIDMLTYCEYDNKFIEQVDIALETLFIFPNQSAAVRLFSLFYKTEGLRQDNPFANLDENGYAKLFNAIPTLVSKEFVPTTQETRFVKGKWYIDQYKDLERAGELDEVSLPLSPRKRINVPCTFLADDGTPETAFISGFTKEGVKIETPEGKKMILDESKVFLHKDIFATEKAIYNSVSVYDWEASFSNLNVDNTEYPTAWHQGFGKVEIIGEDTDEYGHDVVIIRPTDFDGSFLEATGSTYEVGEDEIGEDARFSHEQKPMVCYPCELIDIDSVKPELKSKIEEIFSNPHENKLYQAFSCQEIVDSSFRRDRLNKIIKGSEKNEATSPLVSSLNELVYVVANLPRKVVRGDYSKLYHVELSTARQKALKAKLDGQDAKLPKVPLAQIKVNPIEEPVTVDGVTKYKAEIKDTFVDYMFKRVVNGKTEWVPKMERPMVLAIGKDTGRLYVTPAWWLNKIDRPESYKVSVPLFQAKKSLPKRLKDLSKLDEYFTKVKEVEVNLDLTKPSHLRYFNANYGTRNARYQYIDPRTQEAVAAPEAFVYDPAIEYNSIMDPTADLITASQYYPSSVSDEVYSICDDDVITEADALMVEVTASEANKAIQNVINQIIALGADAVKYELTKDPTVPGKVTIEQKKREWTFPVVRKDSKLIVDTQFKISDKSKNLFSELISLAME